MSENERKNGSADDADGHRRMDTIDRIDRIEEGTEIPRGLFAAQSTANERHIRAGEQAGRRAGEATGVERSREMQTIKLLKLKTLENLENHLHGAETPQSWWPVNSDQWPLQRKRGGFAASICPLPDTLAQRSL
ncbi:MAG TPA: hypothetical protein VJZ71_04200 [Phycisphaerae bacterium]|nr:hypothetical protein [Phycisphaerae bacterium]